MAVGQVHLAAESNECAGAAHGTAGFQATSPVFLSKTSTVPLQEPKYTRSPSIASSAGIDRAFGSIKTMCPGLASRQTA